MRTILNIDADEPRATKNERALKASGYRVVRADTALGGLQHARAGAVDLVLVASPLPDLDAHALVLRLRAVDAWHDKPIVLLDRRDEDAMSMAMAVGASGTVAEPASPGDLSRAVARYIHGEIDASSDSSELRLRSVSERIAEQLEQKLHQLSEAHLLLARHERRRSELLRNVAHELATPITPAVGFVEMLRNGDFGPVNEAQRKALDSVLESMERFASVAEALRAVGAFELHAIMPRLATTPLALVAEALRSACAKVRPDIRVEQTADALVALDLRLITRAVVALVENSTKFGGPDVDVVVELTVAGGHVRVQVHDDGPGIPPAELGSVTEAFHQVDGTATRAHGGVGLGLTLARHVVESHRGELDLESRTGVDDHGTTVTLRWPVDAAP